MENLLETIKERLTHMERHKVSKNQENQFLI